MFPHKIDIHRMIQKQIHLDCSIIEHFPSRMYIFSTSLPEQNSTYILPIHVWANCPSHPVDTTAIQFVDNVHAFVHYSPSLLMNGGINPEALRSRMFLQRFRAPKYLGFPTSTSMPSISDSDDVRSLSKPSSVRPFSHCVAHTAP